MLLRTVFVFLALGLSGCKSCRDSQETSDARATDTGSAAAAPPKLAEPLRFEPRATPRGFGLPSECRLEPPVRSAALPEGEARFLAVRSTLDELAFASGAADGGALSSAWLTLESAKAEPLPWAILDEPPAIARTPSGVIVAHDRAHVGSLRTAFLWRAGGREEELVRGDQLYVADAACDGPRCAILTSLARQAAAPGASLLVGNPADAAAGFRRVDMEAEPSLPYKPFAIVDFDAKTSSAWVALATKKKLALWQVAGDRTELRRTVDTPHGVYDVVMAEKPIVITPAVSTTTPCTYDEFPILLTPFEGAARTLVVQAAPDSAIARPLSGGVGLFWVAPVSCRIPTRLVVHAALLHPDGRPAGSTMAVADASGFAVATDADALSIWLHTEREVSWLKAKCSLPPPGG